MPSTRSKTAASKPVAPISDHFDTAPLEVGVSSETGHLRTVIMCLANPFKLRWAQLRDLDAAFFRQAYHNRIRPYDGQRVREQQLALIEIFQQHGTNVLHAENLPHIGSQHYTRDIGFTIDETFFVARPRRSSRQAEIPGIRIHLNRMSKVAWLDNGTVEGGDVMLTADHVLVGMGEESNPAGADAIAYRLSQLGNPRVVKTIEFSHRGIIHLDTKFNIVGPNLALIHTKTFSKQSLKWLRQHFDLIEATDEESDNTEINTIAIKPGVVVIQSRSQRIADELARHDIKPILVDYSEVVKLPGSFRCTTLPVLRDPLPTSAPDDGRQA
jgi:N-dimethylarginine dimethylaminohydrolase